VTEAEFLNLSDREKDALVAEKVMGFPNVRIGCSCGFIKPPSYSHSNCCAVSPYSTQISAAWEVVEKMIRSGSTFGVEYRLQFTPRSLRWVANFANAAHPMVPIRYGHADTPPLAICIAALKANGFLPKIDVPDERVYAAIKKDNDGILNGVLKKKEEG
jgi:hypothetical protein